MLADQTRLQRLHEQLQQDYDTLRQEREDLKTSERGLRLEIAKLRSVRDIPVPVPRTSGVGLRLSRSVGRL